MTMLIRMSAVSGSKSRITVVDEDLASLKLYQRVLGRDYELDVSKEVNSADLHILEMEIGGAKLEERLRGKSFAKPFIVISRVSELSRMREVMRLGAKSYLVKPVHESALLLAVERALETKQPDFTIDTLEVVSASGGRSQKLTAREMQIFACLRSQWGEALDRDELIKRTWGKVRVGAKSLDVHLFNLRRKLSPLGLKIEFIPERGFRLYDSKGEPSQRKGGARGSRKKS